MNINLPNTLFAVGILQYTVLVASALVPIRLKWKKVLSTLPQLVRQLYWVYGGFVVLSIVSFATICVVNSNELASGSLLARSFCLYAALFWGIRLSLQPFLCAEPFLTTWWLRAGYRTLPVLFGAFTLVFAWSTIHWT